MLKQGLETGREAFAGASRATPGVRPIRDLGEYWILFEFAKFSLDAVFQVAWSKSRKMYVVWGRESAGAVGMHVLGLRM